MSTTPGPWRDEAVTQRMADEMRGPLPQDFLIVGSDGTVIGILYDYMERTPKNARLIAAAPDLLDALNALTVTTAQGQVCFRTGNGIPMGMSKKQERLAKAALAKVESA